MSLLRQKSGKFGKTRDLIRDPSPAIMAGGLDGHSIDQHYIELGGAKSVFRDINKPRYHVATMIEIAAVPWNGLNVISTFAGCGGSSLGYRMAGYRMLWANEFVPAAQASYSANMRSGTILDGRDIKTIQPTELLAIINMKSGDLDVLDGSPPCQAFSTAGKRHKGWGDIKKYEGGGSQKNEDLFFEYVRLLRGLMPRTFVAENVSGLIKGTAKGYFLDILAALKGCGYRVQARLLDAQWLGVPQTRQRIIFVGVRNDLRIDPVFPFPLSYRYSVRDACPWIAHAQSGPTRFGVGSLRADAPAPTVLASMQAPYSAHEVEIIQQQGSPGVGKKRCSADSRQRTVCATQSQQFILKEPKVIERRKFTIAELKRICSFPDDFILIGSYAQQWERLGNSVPPLMMKAIAETIRDQILQKEKTVVRKQRSSRKKMAAISLRA